MAPDCDGRSVLEVEGLAAMRLIPIQEVADAACYLYALLLEREPHHNISHKAMPTVEQHLAFVRSNPYAGWYLVHEGRAIVGAIYLTHADEIGVFIFKRYQGRGHGKCAVKMLIDGRKGYRLLANIAPGNEASRSMFEKLGFTLIQNTFKRTEP